MSGPADPREARDGDLPIAVAATPASTTVPRPADAFPAGGINLESIERDPMKKALVEARSNKSLAAKLLGLPRGQFYSLLRRHGLTDARR
jgi:transcriptional regulator of acetoin/glycerol metabolism